MTERFDSMITNTMSALMTAGTTLKQAQVQQSAVRKDEGHAGILKAEIKNSVKADTAAKEAELKETEEHADELKAKQSETLANTNDDLKKNIDRAEIADREDEKEQTEKTAKTRETVEEYRERMRKVIEEQRSRPDIGETVTTKELTEMQPDKNIDEQRAQKFAESERELSENNTGAAAVIVDPIRVHKPIDIKA